MPETGNTGMTELLPWQSRLWQAMQERLRAGTMPHALLIRGPEGLGKARFARTLAESMLCTDTDDRGLACGRCRGCTLNRAGSHPDLVIVDIPPEKKEISVDQIRALIDILVLKPQYGRFKVVIIPSADAMKHHAANSLLKTLEEPPAGTILLLCSSQPGRLPATIRSRCQHLAFHLPSAAVARDWLVNQLAAGDIPLRNTGEPPEILLAMAAGAPLKAAALAIPGMGEGRQMLLQGLEGVVTEQADPGQVAEEWLKLGVKESLYWLYSWIVDMIRLTMTAGDTASISNPDIRLRLTALATNIGSRRLFQHLDKTVQALQLLDHPLNQQLMLEELLIYWSIKVR